VYLRLRSFIQPESMTGDNKYKCDVCGKKVIIIITLVTLQTNNPNNRNNRGNPQYKCDVCAKSWRLRYVGKTLLAMIILITLLHLKPGNPQ
jgi:DNA-directed RNA polymerase subunit RPC12/RpoP